MIDVFQTRLLCFVGLLKNEFDPSFVSCSQLFINLPPGKGAGCLFAFIVCYEIQLFRSKLPVAIKATFSCHSILLLGHYSPSSHLSGVRRLRKEAEVDTN